MPPNLLSHLHLRCGASWGRSRSRECPDGTRIGPRELKVLQRWQSQTKKVVQGQVSASHQHACLLGCRRQGRSCGKMCREVFKQTREQEQGGRPSAKLQTNLRVHLPPLAHVPHALPLVEDPNPSSVVPAVRPIATLGGIQAPTTLTFRPAVRMVLPPV